MSFSLRRVQIVQSLFKYGFLKDRNEGDPVALEIKAWDHLSFILRTNMVKELTCVNHKQIILKLKAQRK